MTVSAEDRVENQKLNQTAALLSFGWVFGFQLDLLEKNLTTLLAFTFMTYIDFNDKNKKRIKIHEGRREGGWQSWKVS